MEIATPSKKTSTISLEEIKELPIRGFKERNIKKEISDFFGVKVSYNDNGAIEAHYYPYDNGKSYKVRKVATKEFFSVGSIKGLFGRELWAGAGKRIIITEGELDAMSYAQACLLESKKIWPVVSLRSATTGLQDLLEEREWLRGYDEVILAMDNDKAGADALSKVIKIIGVEKVKVVSYPKGCKDFSDILSKKDPETEVADLAQNSKILMRCIWDAVAYKPAGILTKEELKEQMHALDKEPSVSYPACMSGAQTKLKGMRLGQIALYISGTGSGKSTLIREVVLHLLESTPIEDKIGIISLEETPGETARSMASMHLRKNLANEEITEEELNKGFDAVFNTDRVIVLDHQGSINDASIVDQMEYMALMGCKYLFIDHITILVSEGASDLKGNEAIDKIMNDLLRVVKKHRVHIGLVSHLRKSLAGGTSFEEGRLPSLDDIKGSGSIKQVSMDIIAFARNMAHEDENVRNHVLMSVLKCRSTGLTGPVVGAYYVFKEGRMVSKADQPEEEFTEI